MKNSFLNEKLSLVKRLNSEQKQIFHIVMHSINNKVNKLFFVYGHGGIAKICLWRTIISKIKSKIKLFLQLPLLVLLCYFY